MARDFFRALPSVSRLLAHPKTEPLLIRFNREYVVQGCRDILDELRRALNDGHIDAAALEEDAIPASRASSLARMARRRFNGSSTPPARCCIPTWVARFFPRRR